MEDILIAGKFKENPRNEIKNLEKSILKFSFSKSKGSKEKIEIEIDR